MNKADYLMKETITKILKEGYKDVNPRPKYEDGVPAHTLSVNHVLHTYDLSKGEFPITTLRPIAIKSAIGESMWIYKDQSNDLTVLEKKYKIGWWISWMSKMLPNTIGVRYGETVRRHDLVNKLLKGLIEDPYGRRHIISLWQEDDFKQSDGLKPCAFLTMWNVRNKDGVEYLDMTLVQRSSDFLVAGNINQMQYVALQMMVARHCGYELGVFSHFLNNVQIYDRHIEQAMEMLEREPIACTPILKLNPEKKDFYSIEVEDFVLEGYESVKPQLKFDLGI